MPRLLRLCLRGDSGARPMGDAGIAALAAAMDRGALSRLEELGETVICHRTTDRSTDPKFAPRSVVSDLDSNVIRNVGLIALAAPLRLTNLKVLSLNDNRFNEVGVGRLVGLAPSLLEPLSRLERLLLDPSWITDAGCSQLTRAIRGNLMPALRELSVGGNSNPVAQRALQEALLRSLASRPQPVAKVLHARMKLVLFQTNKLKLKLLRRA